MNTDSVNDKPMTIGQLSVHTGVPIKALREYADDGLIYTRGRSPAGYRLFDTDALWCVRLIGRLRGLGLTIAEIRELCRAYQRCSEQAIGPHLATLLRAAERRIDDRISMLRQVRDQIEQFEAEHRAALSGASPAGLFADDPRSADNARTACS